jgi:Tfp pilus assembly protein PilE
MQIVVSIVGVLMMTALAYYRSWSKNADKAPAANLRVKEVALERASRQDRFAAQHERGQAALP